MAANGRHRRLLTYPDSDSGTWDRGPSWSPDGKRIVFARTSFTSDGALYVVAATGGPARSLHVDGRVAAWGPKKIAHIADEPTGMSVWTVDPDGSHAHKLASAREIDDALAWSRDGRLAYLGGDDRTAHVIGRTRTSFRLPFATTALGRRTERASSSRQRSERPRPSSIR